MKLVLNILYKQMYKKIKYFSFISFCVTKTYFVKLQKCIISTRNKPAFSLLEYPNT